MAKKVQRARTARHTPAGFDPEFFPHWEQAQRLFYELREELRAIGRLRPQPGPQPFWFAAGALVDAIRFCTVNSAKGQVGEPAPAACPLGREGTAERLTAALNDAAHILMCADGRLRKRGRPLRPEAAAAMQAYFTEGMKGEKTEARVAAAMRAGGYSRATIFDMKRRGSWDDLSRKLAASRETRVNSRTAKA